MEVLKTDVLGKHKKLICMIGLPYSGKSTIAKNLGHPIVNPDSIRVALHGKKFVPETEPYVWAITKTMVVSLFLSGHDNVILDATNINNERRIPWHSSKWSTELRIVPTHPTTCINRALGNGDDIIVPIINKMVEQCDIIKWGDIECDGTIYE